jgi:hypothetical protein
MWVDEAEQVVIATMWNRQVQAFDVKSGKERWKVEYDREIDAMTCNKAYVYVALDGRGEDGESIRQVDAETGRDVTPKGIPQPAITRDMFWGPGGLCVVTFDEVWIYSPDLKEVATRIPYRESLGEGAFPQMSSDGETILLREHGGRCSVVDPKARAVARLTGKWKEAGRGEIGMDAPFLSNAFYETGKEMVRVMDGGWGTGKIYFHESPVKEAKVVDSENMHAIAAVDWRRKRVAVSGTSEGLSVYTTSGEKLVGMKEAVSARTYAMAFSMFGKRLATLGEDGGVRVFEVK